MMGLPVITQAFSGMDDGYTHEWALVVEHGRMCEVNDENQNIGGEWRMADIDELAHLMRAVYDDPWAYRKRATFAREWLANNQTWLHCTTKLLRLMVDEGALEPESVYA